MRKGRTIKAEPMPSLNTEFSMALLGKAIRSKRTSRGWGLEDAAARIGVTKKTVMKIERGDASVTFVHVERLMDVLGLSLRVVDTEEILSPEGLDEKESQMQSEGWYE